MSIPDLTLAEVDKARAAHQTFESDMRRAPAAGDYSEPPGGARPGLHDVLQHLATTLTLPLALDEIFRSLADLTRQALAADLCVILLRDQARDHLSVAACSPALCDGAVEVRDLEPGSQLWACLCDRARRGQALQLSSCDQEALNPLKNVQYQTLLAVPLLAGSECSGLIVCYTRETPEYSADEQLMLCTIATQTALAIKHRAHVDEKAQARKMLVSALVSDLVDGCADGEAALRRRAYLLGYDLTRPHVVALLEVSEPREDAESVPQPERFARSASAVAHLKYRLRERYPGALVDERNNVLLCLLALAGDEHSQADLAEFVSRMREESRLCISGGMGNPCCCATDYRRGYAEASQALEVARCVNHAGGISRFADLGSYRYLYKFAQADTLHDTYQDRIATLAAYDRQKGADLLDTLEIYLECGGNAARASSQLAIHRNTLLQRLERIEKLCAFDLEQWQQRLPLLLALKVYRLRALPGISGV